MTSVNVSVNVLLTVPDFGEPEIFYETCELVAVSYEDESNTFLNKEQKGTSI